MNSEITTIVACGDLHGMLNELVFKLNNQYRLTYTACFCAGDIGLGFYKENYYHRLLQRLNSKLAKNHNTLFLIRGNHDDPAYWENNCFQLSNIILVPDYTMISIGQTKVLCIGGAISIDRTLRKEGKDYWEAEVFQYHESLLEGVSPDVVITHSAPDICFPYTKEGAVDWMKKDSQLQYDIDQERHNHTLVYEKLKQSGSTPTEWIYGHFHASHTDYFEETKFVLLNELEVYEIKQS
jgi:predicted phosphodiesterase